MRMIRRICVGFTAAALAVAWPLALARAETVPLPGGAQVSASTDALIYSTSCPAAGDCVAVGSYLDPHTGHQPLLETQSGGVWSASEGNLSSIGTINPGNSLLDSVS